MGSSAPPPAGTVGLTYADLRDLPLPEEVGGTRYELLDGELLVTPAPVIRHQRSLGHVYAALLSHTRAHGGLALMAPTDVWFSDQTVFEPDVLAIAEAHLDRVEPHRVVGPPDLIVEVSSPTTRRVDLVRKRRVYEREGVPEFWFVDLDADQVHVYRLGADGTYGAPRVVLEDGVLDAVAWPRLQLPAREALVLDE